ncbi:MAG TPA: triose-phosphate isomerase [Edaphobacter sp.]|nr:triose-phosphate isomerase [Edaphobacter sp.]
MRIPLLAANWKMYKTPAEARAFVSAFLQDSLPPRKEVALFPPAIDLPATIEAARGSALKIGAQNIYFADEGAFTGEISAPMVVAAGATHVLIGHSERRQYFGETDEWVNKKLQAALRHKLTPIVCVGEHLSERENGETEAVLRRQTSRALDSIDAAQAAPIVIAYEPVWAIGTGRTATPEIAQEAHAIIRHEVTQLLGKPAADAMRILYGGSVKPDNAGLLCAQSDIDGALVGGASLDPASFAKIVAAAS